MKAFCDTSCLCKVPAGTLFVRWLCSVMVLLFWISSGFPQIQETPEGLKVVTLIMPRLPLHIRSQIPASCFYFSCSGYLSTGLGNQTGTFSAGLVLFLPFNKRKHQAPAAVQDEQHALSAVSAV